MSLLSATLAEPQGFSLVEKFVLAALLLASIALFFRRFGPILQRILKAKSDPVFSLSPIGKRIWDFFWEVLCQAKVIRERPLPGLAHAFSRESAWGHGACRGLLFPPLVMPASNRRRSAR